MVWNNEKNNLFIPNDSTGLVSEYLEYEIMNFYYCQLTFTSYRFVLF